MIKNQELTDPKSCLNQAAPEEMVFVLRANDPIAPLVVRYWANESLLRGIHLDKLDDAEACAAAMEAWQLNLLAGNVPQS